MKELLTSPMIYLLALLVIIILLQFFRVYKKWHNLIFFPAVFICYLLITPFGANQLLSWISYSKVINECSDSQAILLPGGIDHMPKHENDYSSLSKESLKRAHGAVDWLKHHKANIIISADGSYSEFNEAVLLANYLKEFVLDTTLIEIDDTSQTTHLSAVNLKKRLKTQHVAIITSQLHMRRALATFKHAGYSVCPVISHSDYVHRTYMSSFFPDAYSNLKSETVLHEIIGYLWYSLTDRI